MIVRPPPRRRVEDDNILPLINVVFLLLIFFVIAGAITRDAPFDLVLPSTSRIEDKALPEENILSVAADGQLAFAGQLIDADELAAALADWPQDKALQIRADSGLMANNLTTLLETLREAGLTSVRLLTKNKAQ